MKFKAKFDSYNVLTNGGAKIPLAVDPEEYGKIEAMMSNFRGREIEVEFVIDSEAEREKLFMISHEQRKKIYALLSDIAEHTDGITKDNRAEMEQFKKEKKLAFMDATGEPMFSLSDCKATVAHDFIEWLLFFAMEHDVPLKQEYTMVEMTDRYFSYCISKRKCSVCQKPGADVHHVDAIGMGRNRAKYDDTGHRIIALCREHHQEAERIGWKNFSQKYIVKGVVKQ